MNPQPEPLHLPPANIEVLVKERLHKHGVRYTSGRRALVELLIHSDHPLTIDEITAQLPHLPRSSAYRHLVDFETASVVQRITSSGDFARYELEESLTDHHHHLICESCGTIFDIVSATAFEAAIGHYFADLAQNYGFTAISHRVDVFGICTACSAQTQDATPAS
ncbi:MAG: Fur family transcriptional regulator [Acidimicrobiales bacterium]